MKPNKPAKPAGAKLAPEPAKTVVGEPNHETETGKKLPKPAPLRNPQISAALHNDANADGKPDEKGEGIFQDLAMMTNVNAGPLKLKPGATIKNPIDQPLYDKPKKPVFELGPGKPPGKGSNSDAGSSAGSTTESETSIGGMGQTGVGTKTGSNLNGLNSKEIADSKIASVGPDMPLAFLDATTKTKATSLGQDVKSFNSESNTAGNVEFSLNHKDIHNDLPDIEIAGSRPYQTVSDVISDGEKATECPDGRHCINKDQPDSKDQAETAATVDSARQKTPVNHTDGDAKNMITDCKFRGDCKTEATSKDVAKAISGNLQQDANKLNITSADQFKQLDEAEIKNLSPKERLHKFFGSITVDKNTYNVVGTAEMAKLGSSKPEQKTLVDADVRKHNIGFNVMLPSHILKHFAAPRFKEHSKLLGPKGKKTHVSEGENGLKIKGGIKKLMDTVADANKRKFVASAKEPHVVINKASIATVSHDKGGESGDIGATKPLQGLLLEAKAAKQGQGDLGASAPGKTALGDDASREGASATKAASPANKPVQNNLGSIVTLVGKVRADRINGKNAAKGQGKQSNATSDDAHKKTSVKDRLAVKHMKHNSSETNAANIAETGPSNSIIVSSVIVVIIASFVVVGMAVVAIVSVVARYCRIGKRLDNS